MFTTIVALGTIALQIGLAIIIGGILAKAPFTSLIARHASFIIRALFVGAIASSLIYEYGFGYAPCLLCWYQRIAIFSIGVLVFTTDIRKSALLRKQILALSIAGFVVALFHNYIDIFPTGIDVCGATGTSCLVRYIYEFGYITIPMMSATILLAGILISLVSKSYPHTPIDSRVL